MSAAPMTRARALALYASAATCEDFTAAAHALAAMLAPKARKDSADLAAPISRPGSKSAVQTFLCEWADGSTTYQRVTYAKPGERWAAAFQACDRLRRLRARHRWADVLALCGVRLDTLGPCGVQHQAPAWVAFVQACPMPPLVAILCEETGEAFEPAGTFGVGDGFSAAACLSSLYDEWRERAEIAAKRNAEADAWHAQLRRAA